MTEEKYIVVAYGQPSELIRNKESALFDAQTHFMQYVCDHRSLPLEVTDDVRKSCDVKVYRLFEELDLPLQDWADEMCEDRREDYEQSRVDMFDTYVKLREYFEGSSVGTETLKKYSREKKLSTIQDIEERRKK